MVYQENNTFLTGEELLTPKYYLASDESPFAISSQTQSDLWRFHDLQRYYHENSQAPFSDEYVTLAGNLMPYLDGSYGMGVYIPRDLPHSGQLKTYEQWEREGRIFEEGLPLYPYELSPTHREYRPLDNEIRICPRCERPL